MGQEGRRGKKWRVKSCGASEGKATGVTPAETQGSVWIREEFHKHFEGLRQRELEVESSVRKCLKGRIE